MTLASRRPDHGFSFIELLAYMAIAALLVLAAIPQFSAYRSKAVVSTMLDDAKSLGMAVEALDEPTLNNVYVAMEGVKRSSGNKFELLSHDDSGVRLVVTHEGSTDRAAVYSTRAKGGVSLVAARDVRACPMGAARPSVDDAPTSTLTMTGMELMEGGVPIFGSGIGSLESTPGGSGRTTATDVSLWADGKPICMLSNQWGVYNMGTPGAFNVYPLFELSRVIPDATDRAAFLRAGTVQFVDGLNRKVNVVNIAIAP